MRELLYRAAIRAARLLSPLVRLFGDKLRRGVHGRRSAATRLIAWATSHRTAAPLVWVHAPSVGEALMAKAIIAALRTRMPGVQVAFTHFSPSAERVRESVGADVAEYLPWDHPSELEPVLDALAPAAVVFVRTEIWPELVRLAGSRGVPTALVNGVIGEGSGRLSRGGRWLLADAYRQLAAIGAVRDTDAALFRQLGVDAQRIRVTGDARFDQVWARIAKVGDGRAGALGDARDVADELTLVAGSTWPEDEALLVPAVVAVRALNPIHLVIAPHEPDEAHMVALEARLAAAGLRALRLSAFENGIATQSTSDTRAQAPIDLPDALIIDRMGILADAYASADVAYVGGGFGGDGLHSVVEPAALGVPVLFGPHHGNAREAAELSASGGGVEVSTVAELQAAIAGLARAPDDARARGDAAKAFVESRLGAAEANAELIEGLVATG